MRSENLNSNDGDNLFDAMEELVYIADCTTYELLFVNHSLASKFHIGDYRGKPCYQVLHGFDTPCRFCNMSQLVLDKPRQYNSYNNKLQRSYQIKDRLLTYRGHSARLEIAFDITEQELQKQKLTEALNTERSLVETVRMLSYSDSMTGTANRNAFIRNMQDYRASGRMGNVSLGVAYFDLNGLKMVNDCGGHNAGDQAIIALARTILRFFSKKEVYRIGGDEFIALCPGISKEELSSRVLQLTDYIEESTNLSVSIGKAWSERSDRPQETIGRADKDMYKKKQAFYSSRTAPYIPGDDLSKMLPVETRHDSSSGSFLKISLDDEFRWLLDHYDYGVCISDSVTKEIVYMNPSCRTLLGVPENGSLKGLFCYRVLEGKEAPCSFCRDSHQEKESGFWSCRTSACKSGWIIRSALISLDNKLRHMMLVLDVSTKSKMEKLLLGKVHVENMLLNCYNAVAAKDGESTEKMIANMLSAIGAYYRADRTYILNFDIDTLLLHHSYEWCREGVTPDSFFPEAGLHLTPQRERMFYRKVPYIIRDMSLIKETAPAEYERQQLRRVQTLYAMPLLEDNEVFGIIGIDNPAPDKEDISVLWTLSAFVANQMSRLKILEKRRYDQYHDTLTGLINRTGYIFQLSHMDLFSCRSLGIVVANINGLGRINEEFGLEYGDNVVKTIAKGLQQSMPNALAFRFEGDEFVLLIRNLSFSDFVQCVKTGQESLRQLTDNGVTLGTSWSSDEDKDVDRLLYEANQQMIDNKRRFYARQNKPSRYNDERFLEKLQEDIQAGRYFVYYQPKIDLATGKLTGMEALLRAKNSMNEALSISKVVSFLEGKGLIRYIDFFVLQQVCRLLFEWKKKGHVILPASVNFSRDSLMEDNAVEEITRVVDSYRIPHEKIIIEITESFGDMEREVFSEIGSYLIQKGFGISLDDFCSKYSCVSLLTALPFREVKFDKSMIDKIAVDKKMCVLCRSMMDVCHKMNLPALAEGVETRAQLELLKTFRCQAVQGYYYSKAIPGEKFEQQYLTKIPVLKT